jgi:hypothetical protein
VLAFSLSLSALRIKSPPSPRISHSGVPEASLSVSLIVGVVASISKLTLGEVVPIPTRLLEESTCKVLVSMVRSPVPVILPATSKVPPITVFPFALNLATNLS